MSRYIAREFGIETSHLIDTDAVTAGYAFGVTYRRVDGPAVCGKTLRDGVVLPEGRRVKCRVCRALARKEQSET